MAVAGTAVWRVRPGGNNSNGGGYDPSISPAASGTHGSLSAGTFTDATANAFTSGMVGATMSVSGLGHFKVASFISSSQVTLTGASSITLTGPLSWTVGAGQDYSQQDAAQATGTNLTVDATTNTDVLPDGYTPTAADVGNAIKITSGTGFTARWYFIKSIVSGKWRLDRSPAAAGTSGGSWNLGGAWADPQTNLTSSGPLVAGNTVYVLGSGKPNPASYVYDYTLTSMVTTVSGSQSLGMITITADPATPQYDGTISGGIPCILATGRAWSGGAFTRWSLLWIVAKDVSQAYVIASGGQNIFDRIVGDQAGYGIAIIGSVSGYVIGCEIFSSLSKISGGNPAIYCDGGSYIIWGCFIHDVTNSGMNGQKLGAVINCIFSNCGATGIWFNQQQFVANCTIDGCQQGVDCFVGGVAIFNNIISNVSANGGFRNFSGTQSLGLVDYNTYYSNTGGDYYQADPGPHDNKPGSDPFVGRSTEDYTLA